MPRSSSLPRKLSRQWVWRTLEPHLPCFYTCSEHTRIPREAASVFTCNPILAVCDSVSSQHMIKLWMVWVPQKALSHLGSVYALASLCMPTIYHRASSGGACLPIFKGPIHAFFSWSILSLLPLSLLICFYPKDGGRHRI